MTVKDRVGVAVVGLGRVGTIHLDAIRSNPDSAELVAVVDMDKSLAKSLAEKYNTKFYLSVEEALNDPNIQAMVIGLPNYLHKPVSCQIMETGRHVLVEKPWATNLAEGKEMLDKAQDKDVVLMAGQCFRFSLALQEAKQRIITGEIGEPFSILHILANAFKKSTAPPWWQDVKKTGGLAFTLVGSHTVDFALWIYEGRKPIQVYSEARSINPDFEGMDEVLIRIQFDDDSTATNFLSHNTNPKIHQIFIVGTRGRIVVNISGGGGYILDKSIPMTSEELFVGENLVRSGDQQPNKYALEMREFIEAIVQKREPIVKYSEILMQLAILDAAKKSSETHQPVLL